MISFLKLETNAGKSEIINFYGWELKKNLSIQPFRCNLHLDFCDFCTFSLCTLAHSLYLKVLALISAWIKAFH